MLDNTRLSTITSALRPGDKRFKDGSKWTNLARLGECNPSHHHEPSSIGEIVKIVQRARAERKKVKAVGMGCSPNAISFTADHMIHLEHLNKVVSVNRREMTITVEAGILLTQLQDALSVHAMQFAVIPSHPEMTVAGAMATGMHATGINTKSICGHVLGVKVVTGTGEVLEIGADSKYLGAFACHLGVLGVVVEVTLKCERLCLFRETTEPASLNNTLSTLSSKVTMSDHYRFVWVPHTTQCTQFTIKALPLPEEGAETQSNSGTSTASSAGGASSQAATPGTVALKREAKTLRRLLRIFDKNQDVRALDYAQWQAEQKSLSNRVDRVVRGPWLKHGVTEAALLAATFAPVLQPAINKAFHAIFLNDVSVRYGYKMDVFPMDCLFQQHACEWMLPADQCSVAMEKLTAFLRNSRLKVHFPVEVRFVDADDAWMSPFYKRRSCCIGIVMFRPHGRDAPSTATYYKWFAQMMHSLGGRPHWAKYFDWGERDVRAQYPMWSQFQELQRRLDPDGVFVNEWFAKLSGTRSKL